MRQEFLLRRSLKALCVLLVPGVFPALSQPHPDSSATSLEALPILSYDTDTGFGYGAKVFILNYLGVNESLDLVAFQSSKGERWYRLVASIPDFEVRQGTAFPLAVDLIVDYDRWIAYNYFGVGARSRFDDRQVFTREPLEISLLLSRGISETVVGQIGIRGRRIVNDGLRSGSGTTDGGIRVENGNVNTIGGVLSGRYDSRDSYVSPSKGTVLQLELEAAPRALWGDVRYFRWSFWFQQYMPIEFLHSVGAFRAGLESVSGRDLPLQILVALGGSNNVRGSMIGRFVDRAGVVANFEWRVPIVWRFGAILGADAGRVSSGLLKLDYRWWAVNPVAGLRFSMDTFVVRADIGFGAETTGFFLNFGQLF